MHWEGVKIVVVGDIMLDRYLYGKVQRISPEAPVPVLELEKEENRLGGAANVALNLRSLGVQVALAGIIGEDAPAALLQEEAERQGIDSYGLVRDPSRPTTLKTRLIAQSHHLLRVDREKRDYPTPPIQEAFFLKLKTLILHRPNAIILEDYDKGTLSPELTQEIIHLAQLQHIPVLVDPKKAHFWHYGGSTLFKPNLRELSEALQTPLSEAPISQIDEAIQVLRRRMPHIYTVVTLGERGMLAYGEQEGFIYVPAHYRNIVDVSGAGDTVISVLALALAVGMPLGQAAALANLAGGMVCEYVGVVPLPRDRWIEQAKNLGLL
ncbi:MAG: PfkB family carbohydrate kinase [Bacteroidia bacterium]|nr:PfkB family carbohydrate kinase [Bacteroidia bacterium]